MQAKEIYSSKETTKADFQGPPLHKKNYFLVLFLLNYQFSIHITYLQKIDALRISR